MSTRYRNASYQDEIDNDVEEHVLNEPEVNTAPLTAEEETFKKRYGDLRRHEQEQAAANASRIKALEDQLREATKASIKYPKTEDELAEWVSKYPDVAAMIETMILRKTNTGNDEVVETRQKVEELTRSLAAERAMARLIQLHPDFLEIRADPAFHDWASKKSKRVQDALYENDTDAEAAAEVVDLYKAELAKVGKLAAPAPRADRGAATAVRAPAASAPVGEGQHVWKESDVEKMSERDYNRYEKEIDAARASGKFVYDISGAAR